MTATDLALTDSAHRDMTIPVPGAATDATAVEEMAARYARLAEIWDAARRAAGGN